MTDDFDQGDTFHLEDAGKSGIGDDMHRVLHDLEASYLHGWG